MKYRLKILFLCLIFVFALAFMVSCKQKDIFDENKTSLKWEVFSEEKLASLKGEPVVVMFWADWCPDCIHIKKQAFSDPKVIEASKGINLLEVDCTDKENKKIKSLQKKYGGEIVPTFVFFNREGNIEPNWKLVEPRTADELIFRFAKYSPKKLAKSKDECCEDK